MGQNIVKWAGNEKQRIEEVLFVQKYRTNLLTKVALLFSQGSDEPFYLMLFPLFIWGPICEPKLGRNIAVCLGLGFGIGNALKNYFAIHRPNPEKVWRGRSQEDELWEFSFPSTHALNATAVSGYIAFYYITTYHLYTNFSVITAICIILTWAITISWSRVYLGAHTIKDVLAGILTGAIHSIFFSPTAAYLDPHFITDEWVVGSILSVIFIFFLLHPMSYESRLNYHLSVGTLDYSSSTLGTAAGGSAVSYITPYLTNNCVFMFSSPIHLLLRYIIGISICVATYELSKVAYPPAIEFILKLLNIEANFVSYKQFPKYLLQEINQYEKKANNSVDSFKLPWIRVCTRYMQYFSLSLAVGVVSILVFQVLGI
eukprot:TRINITY_DN21_c1_g1_i1.p1 TRINITY_DN21_c1_g1~~TRINITY_DN21_c1_g1_i1.p1  ORF type:complete len:372 (-),score=41.74 TRINITY_DN21_c1_g1_i1:19-1134(-)